MSNMLRGSLTSTTDAKGVLGFKGERGYSNYEIYVKNGGTMTEQEWLDHFGVDLTGYCKTSEMTSYVNTTTGDLEDLETTAKTDVVSAINELNTNINSLDGRDNYSTTEQVIGTWIDGKPIYRKVIQCGALPNSANKDVAHNIQNFGETISCRGMAVRTSDERALTIPDSTPSAEIVCGATNENVYITTHNDRSSFDDSFLILEYTKTTD